MVVDVSHIDTCLACYLTDHHSGDVIRDPDDEEPDDEEPDDASPADDGGLDFDALARIGRNWQD